MLEIKQTKPNEYAMSGRFDAAQVDNVRAVLDQVSTTCVLDLKDLQYISSAGLGILLMTQKRLSERGEKLKLANMSKHIRDVFRITRLEVVFEILE